MDSEGCRKDVLSEVLTEMTRRTKNTLPQKSKKYDFVNVGVVINSLFLDY